MKEALFIKLKNERNWFQPLAEGDADGSDTAHSQAMQGSLSALYYVRGEQEDAFQGTLQDLVTWVQDFRGDFFDLPLVVMLEGVNLVSMQVNIPSKQAKHIAQALPFMLEDMVAQDVDSLHIAAGTRGKAGELPVILCQKSYITNMIDHFAEAGLQVHHVIADMYCLPPQENSWHFLTDGRCLLVRVDNQSPLTIELDALPVLLNALFVEDLAAPEKITVTVGSDFTSGNLENWLKTQFTSHIADLTTEFEIEHIEQTSFSYLCESVLPNLASEPINLLQGSYKPISKRRPSLIKWKPMTALAGVFVALFVGFQYTHAWKLEEKTDQVANQAEALYKRYFPQDRRIVDIRKQMTDKLENAASQGGSEGFLTLLAMVGEKLNEMNRGADKPRLSPLRITYDETQGDLKIDFLAGGFTDLDALKAKLESMSLAVEIARASQDGDQMKARMNIRSAG